MQQLHARELLSVVDGGLLLNVVAMQLYERVERFARQTNGTSHTVYFYLPPFVALANIFLF